MDLQKQWKEIGPVPYKKKDKIYQRFKAACDEFFERKRARKKEEDSPVTKGFYQWGSMAYYEMYTMGLQQDLAEKVIEMAYWMIDTHETLRRTRNTAYAHEGMLSAYELAKLTGDEAAREKIGEVVHEGMAKLTSWQVGGPNENWYLRLNPTQDKYAVGGVMNKHQMHAVILAKKFLFED